MAEFELMDYVQMQNRIYMDEQDDGPCVEVNVYGDDGEKMVLHVWYDAADQPVIDRCMVAEGLPFFIKAYSENGRDGVNIQTGTIDFSDLGYGPNSTAALRRLIALSVNGWTLQFVQDKGFDVYPKNDNHLDLRRDNLEVGRKIYEWGEERREAYSLPRAKYQLEQEMKHEEA